MISDFSQKFWTRSDCWVQVALRTKQIELLWATLSLDLNKFVKTFLLLLITRDIFAQNVVFTGDFKQIYIFLIKQVRLGLNSMALSI